MMKNPESQEPRNTRNARQPVHLRAELFLAVDKQAEKRRFEKERKNAFHRQGLPDDAAGIP